MFKKYRQAKKSKYFGIEYDKLSKELYGFNPEDESWFFSELFQLITKYDPEVVSDFAKNDKNPIYTTELFIKSGFRAVEKNLLIQYTKVDNVDDVYGAAISLAICGYNEGFDLLSLFVNKTHRLSDEIDPIIDILPDLKYVKDERANIIEEEIRNNK